MQIVPRALNQVPTRQISRHQKSARKMVVAMLVFIMSAFTLKIPFSVRSFIEIS